MLAKLPAPLWVATLLLLILTGLAAATWFIDPIGRYFVGNPLRVETAVPQVVFVNEPFTVTMRLTNLINRPSSRIYLEIGDAFLRDMDWGTPSPPPERMDRYRNRLLLEFAPLPPNGQRIIQLPYTARRAPVAPFEAKIYAPSNQLHHKVLVPITVEPRSTVHL
jgi:uncharacterized protein (DUF58 family)